MDSSDNISKLGLALQIAEEQDFADAAIEILADDMNISEQVEILHVQAEHARHSTSTNEARQLTAELALLEHMLLDPTAATPSNIDLALLQTAPSKLSTAHTFNGMMARLADILYEMDDSIPDVANNMLFRAVARWIFWQRVLLRFEDRKRFCALFADDDGDLKSATDGLQSLLDRTKRVLDQALALLKLPHNSDLFLDPDGGSNGGTRGERQKEIELMKDARLECSKDAETRVIRSSAPIELLRRTGKVNGFTPELELSLTRHGPRGIAVLDTGCSITRIKRNFLHYLDPRAELKALPRPWKSYGAVPNACSLVEQYAMLDIYLDGYLEGDAKKVRMVMRQEVMVVEDYSTDMLIGMDIVNAQQIAIFPTINVMTVGACNGAMVVYENKMHSTSQLVEPPEQERQRMEKLRQEVEQSHLSRPPNLRLDVPIRNTGSYVPRPGSLLKPLW